MPVAARRYPLEDSQAAGLILLDPILFGQYFFADQLGEPMSTEQKLMHCDQGLRVLLCTARKTSKTILQEIGVLQDGITLDNRAGGIVEALFTTPNDVHMIPFVDRLFARIGRNPILRGAVAEMRRGENTIVEFYTGLRYYFRIEGISGKDTNVVGLRAAIIRGDEQAFGAPAVYKSLIQTALPGARWVLSGVPNGVRRTVFYQLDQTDLGRNWSRHKYSTFINPLYYGEAARDALIEAYGGTHTYGYVTQVLGDWGEEMFTSFPEGSIAVGDQPYLHWELTAPDSAAMHDLALLVPAPVRRVRRFALGLDYGFSPDPSELIGAYSDDPEGLEWRDAFRLHLERVPQPHQVDLIRHVIGHLFVGQFIGLGSDHLATVQQLQELDPDRQHLYHHSSPGASTPIPLVDLIEGDPSLYRSLSEKDRKKAVVNVPNKFLWTERFRAWMINAVTGLPGRAFWLGDDVSGAAELAATTERKTQSGHTVYYGPPDPNDSKRMVDHYRDAHLYLVDAIFRGMAEGESQYQEQALIEAMGWAGQGDFLEGHDPDSEWKAPWDPPEIA